MLLQVQCHTQIFPACRCLHVNKFIYFLFNFSFENDDGSKVSQEGQHTIVDDEHAIESIRGSYSYNDVNGTPISVSYTADENGFRPVGAHLPTPPPVPLEILRSLRFLATAKPFVDDELYDYKPKKKVFRGRQYSTLNAVQRSRNNLRSSTFSEPLPQETPRQTLVSKSRESRQESKPETTSQSTPEASTEVTVTTSSEPTTETSDNTKKPAVETAVDVLNDGRKKIKEALKESIEKTSTLTQSATKETANSAIAAIRDEATKLTDAVKTQSSIIKDKISGTSAAIDKELTVPVKESRGIIEEYTSLVTDAASDVDKALVDIASSEDSTEVGLNVKVTI